VHSFATLLAELATIVRNTSRTPGAGADAPTLNITTTPNVKQKHAIELLEHGHTANDSGAVVDPMPCGPEPD
jgi:hypothetical protein